MTLHTRWLPAIVGVTVIVGTTALVPHASTAGPQTPEPQSSQPRPSPPVGASPPPAPPVTPAPSPALPSTSSPASSSTSATRLPVRRVVLYKNGIGYFEHLGRVAGNQPVSIEFTSAQLNDVLKSLTTIDLGGGRISGISYNSEAPLARRLGALRLPLDDGATRTQLFEALRGARLDLQTPGGTVSGRLLSVERTQRFQNGKTENIDALVIVTAAGLIRTIELDAAVSVRIVDGDTNRQVGQFLDLIGSARAQDTRRMTIATAGTGQRPLFVSYISEVPVWKTTYRIVLPGQTSRQPLLQGWAIVDNTVGEDWTGVELSLVAGAPQSFIQSLSQPYYTQRPVVPLPAGALLAPQTHNPGMLGGDAGRGTIAGRIVDESGAALPGVTVAIRHDGDPTAVTQAFTDGDGQFRAVNLAAGSYSVEARLGGFQSETHRGVAVAAGSTTMQELRLRVGALTDAVTVEAPAPQLSASTSSIGRRTARMPAPPPGSAYMAGGGVPNAADAIAAAPIATASAQELGDLFEYRVKEPITIRKNESALVPILSSEIATEKVSLWSPGHPGARPLRALWLTNSSTLTLDGGSFTVIEGDAFAGEGLLDPLQPGARRLVSYAIDLGLLVESQRDRRPQQIRRVRVARGVLTQQSEERQRTVYTLRNEDVAARDVIVEHPAQSGWTLLEGGPAPVESAAAFRRFRVKVDAKQRATLTVDEVHPIDSRVSLTTLTDDQVTLLLRGPIDAATRDAVQAITAKKTDLAAIDRQIAAQGDEVERIEGDQERLRENMKALKGSAEEKELLLRYTRQLNGHEDRLEALRKQGDELTARRTQVVEELLTMVQELSLDVTMPGQ